MSKTFSSTATRRRYVALLTVALAGLWLVHSAHAVPAITWMNVYEPKDVRTLRDLIRFIHNLRVPIPPVIAAAEVLSWQWTGSTALVTDYGYRIALVGSYLLAVSLTPPAGYRRLIATLTAIVFLAATVEIHPGNPQVYDAVLPCLVLIVVASLAHATRSRLWLAGVAGLALALADLTRPFVVVFLPLLLIGGCIYLMRVGRAAAMVFALPVSTFSERGGHRCPYSNRRPRRSRKVAGPISTRTSTHGIRRPWKAPSWRPCARNRRGSSSLAGDCSGSISLRPRTSTRTGRVHDGCGSTSFWPAPHSGGCC
jgi:hypothetical protein